MLAFDGAVTRLVRRQFKRAIRLNLSSRGYFLFRIQRPKRNPTASQRSTVGKGDLASGTIGGLLASAAANHGGECSSRRQTHPSRRHGPPRQTPWNTDIGAIG